MDVIQKKRKKRIEYKSQPNLQTGFYPFVKTFVSSLPFPLSFLSVEKKKKKKKTYIKGEKRNSQYHSFIHSFRSVPISSVYIGPLFKTVVTFPRHPIRHCTVPYNSNLSQSKIRSPRLLAQRFSLRGRRLGCQSVRVPPPF